MAAQVASLTGGLINGREGKGDFVADRARSVPRVAFSTMGGGGNERCQRGDNRRPVLLWDTGQRPSRRTPAEKRSDQAPRTEEVRMKVGLLGAGRIGVLHAGVLARDPGVDTILVGDADPQRAEEVADEVGGEAGRIEVVLGSRPDAVVIA